MDAATIVNRAMQLNPNNFRYYTSRGMSYLAARQAASAVGAAGAAAGTAGAVGAGAGAAGVGAFLGRMAANTVLGVALGAAATAVLPAKIAPYAAFAATVYVGAKLF